MLNVIFIVVHVDLYSYCKCTRSYSVSLYILTVYCAYIRIQNGFWKMILTSHIKWCWEC